MKTLSGRVALVAGGSRGAGRGIALALGDAGATVYVAGRTRRGGPPSLDGAPGTIDDTADEVTARGGVGVAAAADLTSEEQVAALVERIGAERGRLDILVNAVWGGNERYRETAWNQPFWESARVAWDSTMVAGPYAYLLTSRHAARLMARRRGGLMVHLTDGVAHDGTRPYAGNLEWDLAHALVDRLALATKSDLSAAGIAVVSLMPGFMRTERVIMYLPTAEAREQAGFDRTESVEYVGRAVAALANDPRVLEKTGKQMFVADLAREYGFTDVDGKQPPRFVIG